MFMRKDEAMDYITMFNECKLNEDTFESKEAIAEKKLLIVRTKIDIV